MGLRVLFRFSFEFRAITLLAFEISPQAEKVNLKSYIKPFSLVASPTGQEKALSGQISVNFQWEEMTNQGNTNIRLVN